MVRLPGFEPGTHCLEGSCSIHLSYRRENPQNQIIKPGGEIPFIGCSFDFLVGAVRFELTAPWSQTKCATAALRPDLKIKLKRPLGINQGTTLRYAPFKKSIQQPRPSRRHSTRWNFK
jgi:hypothetical protein